MFHGLANAAGVKSKVVENVLFSTNANYFLQKSGKIFYTNIDMSLSGVPIIQNRHLIGAVTHVLVQDASRGYGIFIENMLEH